MKLHTALLSMEFSFPETQRQNSNKYRDVFCIIYLTRCVHMEQEIPTPYYTFEAVLSLLIKKTLTK